MFNYCWFEYHISYFINKSTVQTVCVAWFASRATTDLLTYSSGTDIPNELCFNFSISDYFTEIVNLPALRGCDCQICLFWFWYLFYSSFPSIWKFWSFCCSVSIDLPSNLKVMPLVIVQLLTIPVQIGMVFVIIWEIFDRIIS